MFLLRIVRILRGQKFSNAYIESAENGEFVYDLDLSATESSFAVAPPVAFFYESIPATTISQVAEGTEVQFNGMPWFRIVNIEESTAQGMTVLAMDIESIGDGLTAPRFPELVVGESSYIATTGIIYDANENFASGRFTFCFDENVLWESGYIVVENVLAKGSTQNQVSLTAEENATVTRSIPIP